MNRLIKCCSVFVSVFLITVGMAQNAAAIPAQQPLFMVNSAKPIMMLNFSKDHQIYFKAYDDYSDITNPAGLSETPDDIPDTTYNDNYTYFGYFDSAKCYTYDVSNGYYKPSNWVKASTHLCNQSTTGEWSGNFMNWATMTRLDVIRKILYGGYRSTDDAATTVLERSFLPSDAHAFAKYYGGANIQYLTPFNQPAWDGLPTSINQGITICNVSMPESTATGAGSRVFGEDQSQKSSSPPLIRVAKGNYSFWASNERWQCNWYEEQSRKLNGSDTYGSNGNIPVTTIVAGVPTITGYVAGIPAYLDNPRILDVKNGLGVVTIPADKLLEKKMTDATKYEYIARIKACEPLLKGAVSTLSDTEAPDGAYGECYKYPSSTVAKPVGLLQEYSDNGASKDRILFGLMMGTYAKNKSGGELRKNVGSISDEIAADGTFNTMAGTPGIIKALNVLRPYGYNYSDGLYNSSDSCAYGRKTFSDGECSNWGNPQSEIYLESLRYLAGQTTANFSTASSGTPDPKRVTLGGELVSPAWVPPVSNTKKNYCAPINVLQFNNSSTTYDVDDGSSYNGATDIGMASAAAVATQTDTIGSSMGLYSGTNWFFGTKTGYGGTDAGLCSGKPMSKLSEVSGTCTDAPRLEGSYLMAGLAFYARNTGITISGLTKKAPNTGKVRTFGVALAPTAPAVSVAVPGSITKQKILIQPACQNSSVGGNCAIVDFKVLKQTFSATTNTGSLYVNWEDSEQGGDYDQDMWGTIDYVITSTDVTITTKVVAQSTGYSMGFGYILGGTTTDGYNVQSGINNYKYGLKCNGGTGTTCTCLDRTVFTSGDFGTCGHTEAVARTQTFAIGTGASALKPPLYYASQWGGYSDGYETKYKATLATDLVNRYPDTDSFGENYFYSTSPYALKKDLEKAFNYISDSPGSAAAVATDSTRLTAGQSLYQAKFDTKSWSGELNAYKFDSSGNLSATPLSTTNTMQTSSTGRKVVTYNPTTSATVAFTWANLTTGALDTPTPTTKQQEYLKYPGDPVTSPSMPQRRVDWLLGNATYEDVSGGLRARGDNTTGRNILGDIVNSSPAYVDWQRDFRFEDLPVGGSAYATHLATKKSKADILVVGGNDGMVHAFDAVALTETFAYIPNLVYPKLAAITQPYYGKSSIPHQYTVDGPIAVSDVYIGGGWKTVAIGTLGAGGIGIYALDISNPANPIVLWELDKTNLPSLGYVMGKPIISPLQNDRWGVIFGNGDSSGSTSQLMVIDIESPLPASGYTKILNAGGSTGGLSAPAVLNNPLGQATYVYAGDVNGKIFRFNLDSSSTGSWSYDRLLMTAKDATGNAQPIQAAPTLGLNAKLNNAVMVYVGTGKYYDSSDNSVPTTVTSTTVGNSFYAIADTGTTLNLARSGASDLVVKTFADVVTPPSRTVSESPPVNWATYKGWFIDFSKATGEKVSTKAILIADKLIFPTLIPSDEPCEFGGNSWLMEVVAVGDKYVGEHVLVNNVYNKFLVLGELGLGFTSDTKGKLVGSGSTGQIINQDIKIPAGLYGRQSWRQLK